MRKTTTAVLREILGIKDFEMAEKMGRSVHTIRSLESGRLKLGGELATKMVHETGISSVWLLNGDPTAPAVSANGEPYTRAKFEEAQAEKIYYDQPHPGSRKMVELGWSARLVAILESACARKNYYMALYKANAALDSLQREFGIDEKLYQHEDDFSHVVNHSMARELFKTLLARGNKQFEEQIKFRRATSKEKSKQLSKKKHRR
jgi:plasmid maintenance system antidote protein VapI